MSKQDQDLEDYREKRDFDSSPEPSGGSGESDARFVIQRHDASSLHYDFRIAAGGVLKSWAIPKGPSTDPAERRLAVRTEDHPIDYLDFEGVIPEDQYGARTVVVWDTGEYENRTTGDGGEPVAVEDAVESGHLSVWLDGQKISGGYALTRTNYRGRENWMLVKMDDAGVVSE